MPVLHSATERKEAKKKERGKEGGNWIKKKSLQVNIGEIIKEGPWKTPSALKFLGNKDLEIHASQPKYN